MSWLLGGTWGGEGEWIVGAPSWQIAGAALAGLLVLGLAFRPGPFVRAQLIQTVPLLVALLALLVVLSRISWIVEGERLEAGRTVVLIDSSRSMSVSEGNGRTRLDAARAIAERMPSAEIYHFGGELFPGPPVAANLPNTDISAALQGITRRYAGEKLASIVLVTDGIDRAGLVSRSAPGEAGSLDSALLPALPGPLTVYQVGSNQDLSDLSITEIRSGNFAFLRAPTTFAVDVRATGLALDTVPVSLTRNGQPAGTRSVRLDDQGRGTVIFTITPDMPGRFIYEASVPVPDGDVVPANNQASRAVRIVRDRVRVLQVCGSPSMDQKFLRLFLKEDPGVDLVSFFILRTLEDFGSGYRGDELSLIEFPYRRLFADELATFDLVILQNFDYAPYFEHDAPTLLQNLATYVKQGGALAMVGGDRSFDLGRYAGTPIEEVLPVKLGVPGDATDLTPFQPGLTEAGARHPITRLVPDPAENTLSWSELPLMDGLNLATGRAEGAAILLAHPTRAESPVLAVRQVGQGRTLSLALDSSWRWAFAEAGKGGGNQAYLRFWKNAMRWLVGDPDDQAVIVDVARENVEPGEELRANVRVRDAGFAPVANANVTGSVSGPGGSTPVSGTTGSDGSLALTVPTAIRGAHKVKVEVYAADGARVGLAETVYAVVTRDPELDVVVPDTAALEALTTATGGRFVPEGEWIEPLRAEDSSRLVRDRNETALWAAPLWPILAGIGTSMTWWLRRRSGRR